MPAALARPVAPPLGPDAPYIFAVWTNESREHAAEVAAAAAASHADPEAQLAALVRGLLARRSGGHERDRLRHLDDLLRSDPTVPVTLTHPLVRGEVRRLIVLQWELKRTCMMAIVSALQPMPRVVFVLHVILGLDLGRIAAICDTTADAVKIAWTRAALLVEDYLGARCQHVEAANFCRCGTRLGVALEQGFIRYPEHADELPDTPVAGATHRDVVALYASLPAVQRPAD
jgi:DNA-directed RNA polymerase specialized sigma24 family protein